MVDWPDKKIHNVALWYIRKHSIDVETWQWTRLDETHPEIPGLVNLQADDIPVVSYFRSEASWYLFTTRRILGSHSGQTVAVEPLDVVKDGFGNFKGYKGRETEVMTLHLADGSDVNLEYKTGKASMAPIYYLIFWKLKFPILDKIKAES